MLMPRLRTLLMLGRVSNLPTVWSNCLAAGILSGGGEGKKLALILASGSSLYLGGMFLNDACDADFDHCQRPERPIPSGIITRGTVWAWSLALLLAGLLLAAALGGRAFICALTLLAAIVAYDLWHKRHFFTLGLMAGCRALLYIFAGIAVAGTVSHCVLAAAGGMAAYIFGISLLARHENGISRPPKWPALLLVMPVLPIGLHLCAKNVAATAIGLVTFIVWLGITIVQLWRPEPQTGRAVGRLLAAIVLADWLQVAAVAPFLPHAILWTALFGLTLWLQRRVPAT